MLDQKSFSVKQQSEIANRYTAGESLVPLAEEFSTNVRVIELILYDAGIPLREPVGGKPQTPPDEEKAIVAEYVATAGTNEILERHNICKLTLYNILARHGVNTRTKGELRSTENVYVPKKPRLKERDLRIAEGYQKGISIPQLAEKENMSDVGVTYSLRKQGLFKPSHLSSKK